MTRVSTVAFVATVLCVLTVAHAQTPVVPLGTYAVAYDDWPLRAEVSLKKPNGFIELTEGGKTAYTGELRRLRAEDVHSFNEQIQRFVHNVPDKGAQAYGFLKGARLKECWLSEGKSWLAGVCEAVDASGETTYSLVMPDMCTTSCCANWCLVPATRR
jgi:hypothetical protein